MVGWHHWFSGDELGRTLGDSEGQGGQDVTGVGSQRDGHDWVNEQQL